MHTTQFNVAIVGGGPTGCVLAILLAKLTANPQSLVLFQSEQQSRYGVKVIDDPRVIAVNEGTRVLLEDLGAWPHDAAAIHTIHVSQANRLGRTLIRDLDMGVPALGYVVPYASLHQKLLQKANACGVTVITGASAKLHQAQDRVWVEHDGQQIECRLGVRADGMRQQSGLEHYDQVALLGQLQASSPRPGWAFERFTQEGPFAVLPHPASPDLLSLVWCCSPARADHILKLPRHAQEAEMMRSFGERLGDLKMISPSLGRFALYKSFEPTTVDGRTVSIGNAAQTLHPVAGQGLNLALRDAATLAHCLRDWIAEPERPLGKPLAIYTRLRDQDRTLTSRLTDLMSRVFTTRIPVVEHAAGLALLSLDLCPPARSVLARHLMQGLRA